MFGFALVVLLFVVGGASRPADARCDLVEINHYSPGEAGGFVQLIAWDWSPDYRRWHAQQWLIVNDWKRIGDVVSCSGDGVNVRVASKLFRETWTATDPERENQVLFPINERRKVF